MTNQVYRKKELIKRVFLEIIYKMFKKPEISSVAGYTKNQPKTNNMAENAQGGGSFIWEVVKTISGLLLFLLFFRFYIYQPFTISGSSMEPSFHDKEYIVVNEFSYHIGNPQRGDVVIFKHPEPACNDFVSQNYINRVFLQGPCNNYIKRVAALPGETIQIKDGKVVIKNKDKPEGFPLTEKYILSNVPTLGNITKTLKDDEYFVLGDNRMPNASSDSREWGILPRDHIVGKAFVVLLPFNQFEFVKSP
jgi:signal peptidase I